MFLNQIVCIIFTQSFIAPETVVSSPLNYGNKQLLSQRRIKLLSFVVWLLIPRMWPWGCNGKDSRKLYEQHVGAENMCESLFFWICMFGTSVLRSECLCIGLENHLGPVHTGGGAPCNRRKQIMGHTVVNASVHTGCKQYQRVCTQICLRVLCEQGLSIWRQNWHSLRVQPESNSAQIWHNWFSCSSSDFCLGSQLGLVLPETIEGQCAIDVRGSKSVVN